MKKCEFKDAHIPSAAEKQEEINEAKHEETTLPFFSKEVPVSSKKYEMDGTVVVEYSWRESRSPSMKVKKLVYGKGENLQNLYRINREDGFDTATIKHNNRTYILRKTAGNIARALYNASKKIKASLESVVGYIKTVLGHHYTISRVENGAWAFDREIAFEGINHIAPETLQEAQKRRLSELIAEAVSELHSKNLMLGKFSLDNVLLFDDGLRFTDLRNMRVPRKKSLLVDEFKRIMQYLFFEGLAGREEITCAVVYYSSENEDSCREWYCGNSKKEVCIDSMMSKIEKEILD